MTGWGGEVADRHVRLVFSAEPVERLETIRERVRAQIELAADGARVALGRALHDRRAVARARSGPTRRRRSCRTRTAPARGDRQHGLRRQRDQVRVAVHEADPAAVRDHLHDVAGQQRVADVQHGAAGEVAAAADQRQPVAEIERLALPQLDVRVAARDPLAVVGVQVHRAVVARAPSRPCPCSSAGARWRCRSARRGRRRRRTAGSPTSAARRGAARAARAGRWRSPARARRPRRRRRAARRCGGRARRRRPSAGRPPAPTAARPRRSGSARAAPRTGAPQVSHRTITSAMMPVVDVLRYVAFSDRPDGGNPAGVVLDAVRPVRRADARDRGRGRLQRDRVPRAATTSATSARSPRCRSAATPRSPPRSRWPSATGPASACSTRSAARCRSSRAATTRAA